jgi:hypothetical protein
MIRWLVGGIALSDCAGLDAARKGLLRVLEGGCRLETGPTERNNEDDLLHWSVRDVFTESSNLGMIATILQPLALLDPCLRCNLIARHRLRNGSVAMCRVWKDVVKIVSLCKLRRLRSCKA